MSLEGFFPNRRWMAYESDESGRVEILRLHLPGSWSDVAGLHLGLPPPAIRDLAFALSARIGRQIHLSLA